MAIPIIDNFDLAFAKPLDSRFVVPNEAFRTSINFNKYVGLRVYQIDNGKTYLYTNNNEWLEERNITNVTNVTNIEGQSDGNGIYGGSGSLIGDTRVFLGTLSDAASSRTKYFFQESADESGDKNTVYNYIYRNGLGINYNSMVYRIEQKLTPFGANSIQGGYIDFNGVGGYGEGLGINFGAGKDNQKTLKMTLDSSKVSLYGSSNQPPFSFYTKGDDFILGYNASPEALYYESNDENVPSYRMRFGVNENSPNNSLWNFEMRAGANVDTGDIYTEYTSVIQIDNSSSIDTVSQSPIKLLVDSTSRDWDGNTTTNFDLFTPQEIVRKIEHRYEKIQMWNKGTFVRLENEVLLLEGDGNSFDVNVPDVTAIRDIKCYKTDLLKVDFPVGTVILVKFRNISPSKPGFLRIKDGNTANTSNIVSEITDYTFEGSDRTRLTIIHDSNYTTSTEFGDSMIFKRNQVGRNAAYWEIVNVSRETRITKRLWNTGTPDWEFTQPRYLSATGPSGKFIPFASSSVYNTGASLFDSAPNAFNLPTNFSSAVGVSRELINPEGFKFRISVDGNRIVFVQGNFRLDFKDQLRATSQQSKLFLKTDIAMKKNIWSLGKLNIEKYLPQWETVWTYVKVFATVEIGSNNRVELAVYNPLLSINRKGFIFFEFQATSETNGNISTFCQNPIFEVWVPPFSYIGATGPSKD